MPKPLISVIMPAFNAAEYMAESIDTVICQTFTDWELIVINDGSTDDTEAIAHKYVAADARIKLINQTNKKLSAARNAGIQAATGPWIAFLDADDLWMPEKLALQIQSANTCPQAGVIFTDGYVFQTNNTTNTLPYGTVAGYYSGSEMYRLEYQGNYIPVLSVLVKKELLDTIGLQDEQLTACQDWDYWLRLAANGAGFYGLSEKLFYYRRHASNMSNDSSLMVFEQACVFIKNFKRGLFTSTDLAKLKSFLNITICNLIRAGEMDKAIFLNRQQSQIRNKAINSLSNFFMNLLGERSYLLVRLIFKADTLLSKNA
ncbi:MAG: glycosyltransferase family A protein [Bacteroidota bacterium]